MTRTGDTMSAHTTHTHTDARTHHGNALDLLEREDLELRRLFTMLQQRRGLSVEERADYGDLAKKVIRHMATREAALVDVMRVLGDDPAFGRLTPRLESNMLEGRPYLDRAEKMSRGIQGMNLRTGQDFDTEMLALVQVVGTEIEWELNQALPELKGSLAGSDYAEQFKSAGHIESHAPTNLHATGPRWWESAPFISRLITVYDRLRDFPRASKRGI
jgi:hypothetical protein